MYNKQQLAEFLRVDHAGERAAQTIYKGQLAVLKNQPAAAEIQLMMEQEQVHLDTFDTLLNEYQVRPSLLDPVWGFAGFSLGIVSAALGPKAAMACTRAAQVRVIKCSTSSSKSSNNIISTGTSTKSRYCDYPLSIR